MGRVHAQLGQDGSLALSRAELTPVTVVTDQLGPGYPHPTPAGMQGPFRSIYDLYRVKAVRTYYTSQFANATNPNQHEPDDSDGDFSPYNWNSTVVNKITPAQPAAYPEVARNDGIRDDFEEKFALLNREEMMDRAMMELSFCMYKEAGHEEAMARKRKTSR